MEDKPMILIAEDDPDDQLLIRAAYYDVCPAQAQIHFVQDGIELLSFLNSNGAKKPNLIVLDLNMPRKDGREALKEIKADPRLSSVPTVILTTSNREEDVQYCQSFGIEGYYRKPGSMYELREIIGKLCSDYLH